MKLIDKSALVARIKKLKMDIGYIFNEYDEGFWEGRTTAFDDVICAIGNLKVKDFWKSADGEDLPDVDRGVIVLTQPYPLEGSDYVVSFAHRPNPNGWDGKSVTTGKVEHYIPKTYDKGGWSIPNVVWWLDCDLPKKRRCNYETDK